MIEDVQIILAGLWVTVVLLYLYGDVLSIIGGDVKLGEMNGKPLTQKIVLIMAILMVIPILMIVLSLTIESFVNRWINIIVALFFFGMNIFTLKGYPLYEKFTLMLSLLINLLIIWYAWNWV